MAIEDKQKKSFLSMVDSLKKSRRADLSDINDDDSIIEELYIDPLEGDVVLQSCLQSNTTILIGRKGTGKSTIIARLQHEYRKSKDKVSLYIDVKTIFEQSRSYNYKQDEYKNVLNEIDLQKYLLYKNFLKLVILQIKSEVKTNTLKFFMFKITALFGIGESAKNYEEQLDNIFKDIDKDEYIDIEVLKQKNISDSSKINNEIKKSNQLGGKYSIDSKVKGVEITSKEEISLAKSNNNNRDEQYSEVLLKVFNPSSIMKKIKDLLKKIGIKHIFICLDDFSEIEEDAMRVFVDTIIAPLNNWSDEYFKFKIAAYPGRIYLGDIDPQKIEQFKLDYYDLYQSRRVNNIQLEAQNSVKKLLKKRIQYFCKTDVEYFFDVSKNTLEDYYKLLFDITASVPRNVGWILWYVYQNTIAKNQKITIKDLVLASEKYFSDVINPYFSYNKFMREPFDIKLEKYYIKEVLDNIIRQAKTNKSAIATSDSKIFINDKSNPPTSHFYIDSDLEKILLSLELNFFITKYNEQKDQDSIKVMSFYSLNYGLCMKEDLFYGRGSDRKYIVQRRFNYTDIINKYIKTAKQIKCKSISCNKTYSYDELSKLQLFDMLCPTCKKSECEIQHVSIDIPIPEIVEDAHKIEEFDMQLLNSLNIYSPQYPTSLGQELDCTYQKVTKRANKMKEIGLIVSDKKMIDSSIGERTYYYLTEKAKNIYFNN